MPERIPGPSDVRTPTDDGLRAKAVADVFLACALMVERGRLTKDEWVAEVTLRFKAAWAVIAA